MEAAHQSQTRPGHPLAVRWNPGLRAAAIWLPALAAGLVLRLLMLKDLYVVSGDSLIYGELGKNLLLHRCYCITPTSSGMVPTLIRLPGYPLFLALSFRLTGMENYFGATLLQIALELLGCVLVAEFAARIAPPRLAAGARLATLWIAVLCPFTASYAALPLAETPTLFVIALALWAMARFVDEPRWTSAVGFSLAISYAALLRPDGILVGAALVPALLITMGRNRARETSGAISLRRAAAMGIVCTLLAIAPFAAWTWRNWRTFHVLEPLAPRYAVDPGQEIYPGWQRWIKTWCLDFVSTYQVYWPIPGAPLALNDLPSRAFDSPAQYAETAALAAAYNDRDQAQDILPDVDAGFGRLAAERIAAHPLRFYALLPVGRVADMWLRPRIENLNIDLDWWVYAHHRAETRFSWEYAGLNLLYLWLAAAGLWLRPRFWRAMLAYAILRSALLLTVEAPETRYTLECFPMLFALAGIALSAGARRVLSRVSSVG